MLKYVQTMLKLIINYPMTLADGSAHEGNAANVSTTNVLNERHPPPAGDFFKRSEGKLNKDFSAYSELAPDQFLATDRNLVSPEDVIERNVNCTVSPVEHDTKNNSTLLSINDEPNVVISVENKPIAVHASLPLDKGVRDLYPLSTDVSMKKTNSTERHSFKPADNSSKSERSIAQSSVTVQQLDSSTNTTDSKCNTPPSITPHIDGNCNTSSVDSFNSAGYVQSLPTTVSLTMSSCSCNFNESRFTGRNMNVKQSKTNGSKSPTRRDRALAPSFTKPLVRHSGDNKASSSSANDSSDARTTTYISPVDMLPTNVEKESEKLLNDSAILHISTSKYVSPNSGMSPVNGSSVSMGRIQVEKSNQGNLDDLVADDSYPETTNLTVFTFTDTNSVLTHNPYFMLYSRLSAHT